MWIGIFLVVFGALMLLQHMGIIRGMWGYLWPAIIIAVGLSMIINSKRKHG
jgi:hypothetical protein